MENKFNDVKVFIGPMSKNIVDSVIEFCEDSEMRIGLIPSRRQVEYSGGYVNKWETSVFSSYVKEKTGLVVLQRDHGGRGQGDNGRGYRESFKADAASGFDLIHIDPWKKYLNMEEIVRETCDNIIFCNSINNSCNYEVGTEEAIHKYTHEELDEFLTLLKIRLGSLWSKVSFAVVQGGTRILGTENIGIFDEDRFSRMIEVCNRHGLLSKEHNGDYLTLEQIKRRFGLGLSAINIAPEFGVEETGVILGRISNAEAEMLYHECLASGRWKKWFADDYKPSIEKKEEVIMASCHYIFSGDVISGIKETRQSLNNEIIENFKLKILNLTSAYAGDK